MVLPEFLVGAAAAGIQPSPVTAVNSSGGSIDVWQDQVNGEYVIRAQAFDSLGDTIGPALNVNAYTGGDCKNPSVAMDAAGDFVITWSAYGEDGSGWGIYGQRYNALAQAQGGEFQINTYTTGDQVGSHVAMDSVGNFTVVWASAGQDGSGWGVYGQRFNALGVAQGSEFRVNTTSAGDQEYSAIAMNGSGNFVVTWSSYGQDGSGWGVYAQRYNALGSAQGGEFQVNTYTQGDQMYPSVATDTAGDFVITWSSYGQDGSGWGVYAQRYNALGSAQGSTLQVNSYTQGDQMYSSVAMDASGNFTIVWQSNGQDGSGWGVYGQQFSATGAKYGSEFRINRTTAGDQFAPSIAMTGTGLAFITWSGNGVGASNGVFAAQYQLL
jgi:hypothetical protein